GSWAAPPPRGSAWNEVVSHRSTVVRRGRRTAPTIDDGRPRAVLDTRNETQGMSGNGRDRGDVRPRQLTRVPGRTAGKAKKIHVLEIVGNAIVGGMERHVHNLARLLPADRFQVTCLAPFESSFTADLRRLGCEVYVAPVHDDLPW